MSDNGLRFELPKNSPSIIKVVGVGGGGSNAVNHMFNQGIKGVDFIICNTDHQALDASPIPHKIQLGASLTEGLGAGSQPEVGMNSAIESIDDVRNTLSKNTKMIFITAGMGGGTGTGAAPIIAQVAREMGILTVGIVTMPFFFEGRRRRQQAEEGVAALRKEVDTLLIINNDKLREMYGNLRMSEAFAQADDVLTTAAKGIAEIITRTGHVNVDFEDVRTVMAKSGAAIMGSSNAEGENRAIKAVEQALASPLLNDNEIKGARYVLLNMEYGNNEITMDEIADITDFIQEESGMTAEVIWGYGQNDNLGESMSLTIIATGFETNTIASTPDQQMAKKPSKVVHNLESDPAPAPQNQFKSDVPSEPEVKDEPFIKNGAPESIEIEFPMDAPKNLEPETPASDEPFVVRKEEPKQSAQPQQTSQSTPFQPARSEKNEAPVEGKMEEKEDKAIIEDAQNRAAERLQRLKEMGGRLRNPQNMSEMEGVPAYKRRNINLDDVPHSSESQVSRYTLTEEEGPDGEKKMEIKPNNSFLHDNVD